MNTHADDIISDELAPEAPPSFTNRRRFLFGGGVLAAGAVLAACGDDDEESSDTTAPDAPEEEPTTTAGAAEDASGDIAIAMFAASLEVLAVNTYQAALDAATQGALGDVPPAVAEFVATALEHHQAALDAWNEAVVAGGETEVSEPPADLANTVNTAFGEVDDVTGAAELALMLEQIAGSTYLDVIPKIQGESARSLAGSIYPIAQQHAAVLLFVLGQYPVPEDFVSTERSVAP